MGGLFPARVLMETETILSALKQLSQQMLLIEQRLLAIEAVSHTLRLQLVLDDLDDDEYSEGETSEEETEERYFLRPRQ